MLYVRVVSHINYAKRDADAREHHEGLGTLVLKLLGAVPLLPYPASRGVSGEGPPAGAHSPLGEEELEVVVCQGGRGESPRADESGPLVSEIFLASDKVGEAYRSAWQRPRAWAPERATISWSLKLPGGQFIVYGIANGISVPHASEDLSRTSVSRER